MNTFKFLLRKPEVLPVHFWVRRLLRMDLRFPCYVLSTYPLILISFDLQGLHFFLPYLKGDKKVWIFVRTGWTYHDDQRINAAKKAVAAAARCGNVNICYLTNSEDEDAVCEKHGIPSLICNMTSFVDEDIFTIHPTVKKRYKAIYDARLRPFKRHELASLIDNLALLTYREKLYETEEHNAWVQNVLVKGVWLNDPFGPNYRHRLAPAEVAEYLNQAEVGLMLSAKEGGTYASIQYLLCGLPVVSTRSIGGRDAFYDPDYVAIVDDTPQAVAQGVEKILSLTLSREEIRSRTLLKINNHRNNLIRRCQEIYNEAGRNEDFSSHFKSAIKEKFHGNLTIKEFKELVQ